MRQGQQNRRGRGRSHNNGHHQHNNNNQRRGQNPLTRSFESNGPEVKIRGTPAHIAEKYMTLARDALSSGDPVLAENYLQHAEHYNRIILTFREQQSQQGGEVPSGGGNVIARHRSDPHGSGDDLDDEDGEDIGADGLPQIRGVEPQPRTFDQPRFDDRPQRAPQGGERGGERPPYDQQRPQHQMRDRHQQGGGDNRPYPERFDRGDRPDRQPRHDRAERFDRPNRADRPDRPERHDRPEGQDRAERIDRQPVPPVPQEVAPVEAGVEKRREPRPAPADRLGPVHEQPEFLRRPVRRPRREPAGEDVAAVAAVPAVDEDSQE